MTLSWRVSSPYLCYLCCQVCYLVCAFPRLRYVLLFLYVLVVVVVVVVVVIVVVVLVVVVLVVVVVVVVVVVIHKLLPTCTSTQNSTHPRTHLAPHPPVHPCVCVCVAPSRPTHGHDHGGNKGGVALGRAASLAQVKPVLYRSRPSYWSWMGGPLLLIRGSACRRGSTRISTIFLSFAGDCCDTSPISRGYKENGIFDHPTSVNRVECAVTEDDFCLISLCSKRAEGAQAA